MNKFNKKLQFLLFCISICYIKFSYGATIVELDANDDTPSTKVATTVNSQTNNKQQSEFINVIMKPHAETIAINNGDNVRFIYQGDLSTQKHTTGILWLYAKLNSKYMKHALAGVSLPENKVFFYNHPKITAGNNYNFNTKPVDSKRVFANSTVLELKNVTQDCLGKFVHRIRNEGKADTETFAELTLQHKPTVTTNSYSMTYLTTNSPCTTNRYNSQPVDDSFNNYALVVIAAAVILPITIFCLVYTYIKYGNSNQNITDKNHLIKDEKNIYVANKNAEFQG